jgi:hypothetical protein
MQPRDVKNTRAATSENQLARLVAIGRRRHLCRSLVEASAETHTVTELADRVAEREPTESDPAPSDERSRRLALQLYHVDLPLFADAGVLDFDHRELEVRYEDDPELSAWFEAVLGGEPAPTR